jgi:hypothetical protein
MAKWIKIEKSSWGLSVAIVIFDSIALYIGKTDHWGIGANVNFYDRSFTVEILNLYAGVEIYHSGS